MNQLVYIIQTPPSWLKTPPLALTYLKNYLTNQGISVRLSDLNISLFKAFGSGLSSWLSLNKDFEANLFSQVQTQYPQILNQLYKDIDKCQYVGFPLLKRNASFAFSLANQIKQRFGDKKIIFGGPQVLFLDKNNQLNKDYYWVVGEGEIPFSKIITDGEEKIYRFKELEDLDSLPFYDFSGLNHKDYSQTLPLLSSRGCPYQCNFCSERLLYKKFRQHSPQYIVDQVKYLKDKYKTSSFVFLDSLINYKKEWLQTFCSLLIKNQLNIKWEAQIRIEKNFPVELARLIKQSGCYNLFIGLESGSEKVLKLMNKGFNTTTAVGFFKTLKAAELHFEISLIFSYPGETIKEFTETVNFIAKNKSLIPKIAQVNPFTDYLENCELKTLPQAERKARIQEFLKVLEREKIRYTKSFINNLIYPC